MIYKKALSPMLYLQEEIITNIDDAEAASPTMVFCERQKARGRKTQKASRPSRKLPTLTKAELRDNAKLLAWFTAEKRRRNYVRPDHGFHLLNVFCAAERALEHGHDPPALFVFIVNNSQWHLITDGQEDRAVRRLRRMRNPIRETQRRTHPDLDRTNEPSSIGDTLRDLLGQMLTNNRSEAL
jgi:hypothetical protein